MKPSPALMFRCGAILAALGVALGAFGAHALKDRLDPQDLAIYEKAVLYLFVHALALSGLGLGLTAGRNPSDPGLGHRVESRLRLGGGILLFGTVVFCSSLLLVVTGLRFFGAIAPIGGTAFVAGWLVLASAGLGPGSSAEAEQATGSDER